MLAALNNRDATIMHGEMQIAVCWSPIAAL
jgi:hypothetical protein